MLKRYRYMTGLAAATALLMGGVAAAGSLDAAGGHET